MTSFIAAGGSGRSTSVIPAVPAASSATTIAFIEIVSSRICHFGRSRTNADVRLPADSLEMLMRPPARPARRAAIVFAMTDPNVRVLVERYRAGRFGHDLDAV